MEPFCRQKFAWAVKAAKPKTAFFFSGAREIRIERGKRGIEKGFEHAKNTINFFTTSVSSTSTYQAHST